MDIEALVKKHCKRWEDTGPMRVSDTIRAALTELSAAHAIELRAYEATVANLEARIRELEAERVPEGWMRDRLQVEGLITHLEGIAYRQADGEIECVDQAAAMSVDVLRLVLLPMLAAAPKQKKEWE